GAIRSTASPRWLGSVTPNACGALLSGPSVSHPRPCAAPRESILLPRLSEADCRPFLDRGPQVPRVAREKHRHAVMILGQCRMRAGAERVELGWLGIDPARRLIGRVIEPGPEPILQLEARRQNLQLQGADDADNPI